MNIKQEGEGYCRTCNAPLLTAIGRGTVCLACEEAKLPKTGRTIVVTSEQGTGLEGTVTGHEVEHHVGEPSPLSKDSHLISSNSRTPMASNVLTPSTSNDIRLNFSLSDLEKPNILLTIMQALYDGIDNLPPPATLKETKKAIAIQGVIEAQIRKLKGER